MERTGRSEPNAETVRPAAPDRAAAVFVFLLAWAAGLCAVLDGHLGHAGREAFVESRRALARHYALAGGDALLADDALLLEAYARRLAGEPDARYAAFYDEAGRRGASAGPAPETPAGAAGAVTEGDGAMEFSETVHAAGRARGTLRWSVGTAPLDRARRARRWRLAGAWFWAAATAGIVFRLLRRRAR